MHVAVAIVGFRNLDDIARCLASLEGSTHRNFEVVVCENGGPEAFETLRHALPGRLAGGQTLTLICAPGNIGYGAGVNRCLEGAPDADAWWVLNPDTIVEPGAMAALVARLSEGDAEAVGGVLRRPDGRIDSLGGRWTYSLARSVSIGYGAAPEAVVDRAGIEKGLSYLTGASVMVSRRFLEATGPMREDYFLYCEEV
ncbi:MAG: glycosyltransferase family 2 protein, partial [Proteobacteria bacterium]|nr:glycosyltransferase family 2 protein [Pseudomonadota bacterium]